MEGRVEGIGLRRRVKGRVRACGRLRVGGQVLQLVNRSKWYFKMVLPTNRHVPALNESCF